MKVLIVDDEEHVRIAVKMLIKWDAFDIDEILEANNGLIAEEIIKEKHPQIVLTDINMPHRTGLDLLSWIQEFDGDIQVVIISIYSQFDYIQQVIRNGGVDYILKPINPKQLNEAIEKAVANYKRRRNEKKIFQENTKYKRTFWVKKFSNIISNSDKYFLTIQEIQEKFKINDKTSIRVGVLRIYDLRGSMKEVYGNDYDLLEFSIVNVCDELMEEYGIRGISFVNQSNPNEIIIVMWSALNKVNDLMVDIITNLENIFAFHFHIGLSNSCSSVSELYSAYKQSVEAIKQRKIHEMNQKLFNYIKTENRYHFCFGHISEKLMASVIAGDIDIMKSSISQALDKFNKEEYDNEFMVVKFIEEFKMLKQKWMLDWGHGNLNENFEVNDLNDEFLNGSKRITGYSIRKIEMNILIELQELSGVIKKIQVEKNDYILLIKNYLDYNYHTGISLQELADQYNISKEHLSRTFKERIGTSISDYILRKKIEKAKILIGNEDLKLKDIAEIIGYNDERYMSKVFKKYCGVTPKQYRKKLCETKMMI